MPDRQSGAVHSLVCGTIIYKAVAGDIGVCHEGDCRKAMCDQGCSSGREAVLRTLARGELEQKAA